MKAKHAKTNQPSRQAPNAADTAEDISARGKRAIACGIASLALGFFILSYSDPMGRNWASKLAPFLILGGYTVIGLGIFLPDPGSEKTTEGLPRSSQQSP